MKRMKLVRLFPVMLTLVVMTSVCWADDPDPDPVPPSDDSIQGIALSGVSQESAAALDGAYVGSTALTIGGVPGEAVSISDPLALTGAVDNFGCLVGRSAHVFNLGNGNTFTTVDDLRLLPTQPGWFLVYGTMEVTAGTGKFAQVHGKIDVYGEIHVDETSVTAMSLLEGRIEM
jgi:hypothetical protein